MNEILSNQLFIIFSIILIGHLVGMVKIKGVSLGNSGCLFVALVFGALGSKISPVITQIGIILFVYSIGLQAGPRFFSMFKRRGYKFAVLGLVASFSALIMALVMEQLFSTDMPIAVGVMAGAMTSTPALASAIDSLAAVTSVNVSDTSLGYALAYPFGVIGVVLFVQLLPKFIKGSDDSRSVEEHEMSKISNWEFKITNPNLEGKVFRDLNLHQLVNVNITRIKQKNKVSLITPETIFSIGDIVLAVGHKEELKKLETILGERVKGRLEAATHILAKDIFVSSKQVIGKTLKDLALTSTYGVVVTRIRRNDIEFAPSGPCYLEHGDLVRVVGDKNSIKKFKDIAGSDEKTLDETNILVLSLGLVLGIALGMVPFKIANINFKLGLAGGPLFVALLFSHFGKIGPLNVRVPNAAKFILRELGLVLFLVGVGVNAGSGLVNIKGGLVLQAFFSGVFVTIFTLLITFTVGYKLFKLPIDMALGAVCGGLTSTPAFGVLTKEFEGTNGSISYASVYPVALISIAVFTQLFVLISTALL